MFEPIQHQEPTSNSYLHKFIHDKKIAYKIGASTACINRKCCPLRRSIASKIRSHGISCFHSEALKEMGKAGKWLRQLLTGSKEKKNRESRAHSSLSEFHSGPISAPSSKEKKRWSFRRPTAAAGATQEVLCPSEKRVNDGRGGIGSGSEVDRRKHAMAVAAATAAAADAALAAAQAAATIVMHLTTTKTSAVEGAAAVKIQAAFRSYLARKALLALKGLVKLQALVRGRLVRRQATATMRCMQTLIRVQARAQQQKIRLLGESAHSISNQRPGERSWSSSSSSQHHHRRRQPYENDKSAEENIKIVEMDIGQAATPRKRHGYGTTRAYGSSSRSPSMVDSQHVLQQQQILAAPSLAPSDISLRTYSGRFGECSYSTVQNSPQYSSGAASLMDDRRKTSFDTSRSEGTQQGPNDHCSYYNAFFPNYMANTESSRAKARSQSAPKQRPDDTWERSHAVGRRRPCLQLERRSIPRNFYGMQRSSSNVKPATNLYPVGCIKPYRSNMSLGESGH